MDQRKNQSYSLGICNRLINFIRTRFTPVTLMGFKGMIFQCSFCRGLAALFDFIIQSLAGQAIKQVPLGPPVHNNSLQVPTSNMSHQNLESDTHEWSCDEGGQSARANFTDKNGNDLCLEGEKAREDVATPTIGTEPTGPPKKTVSFSDRVEVIYPSKDKKKKKKETKKLTSMEREMDEEPKPGKSILKMGSNLNAEQGKL
ncbi:hypothetical protein ACSBR2_005327 [Camellia fascicularis]